MGGGYTEVGMGSSEADKGQLAELFYCGSLVDRKRLASFGCAYQPPQAGGQGWA